MRLPIIVLLITLSQPVFAQPPAPAPEPEPAPEPAPAPAPAPAAPAPAAPAPAGPAPVAPAPTAPAPAATGEVVLDPVPSPDAEPEPHKWHLELAAFPVLTVQQIEGPNRDDFITEDGGISIAFSASYAPIPYLEPGLWVQVDAGSIRRAVFSRPDDDGVATEEQLVEGSYWALWVAFMLRSRLGPAFLEAGWAPLILRDDTTRSDLPNASGATDGLFEGSRAVAWLLGTGASIPVFDYFDVTLRIQFRIRYLVSRGGEPLADDEETGQMTVWPFMGTHFHF